MSKIIEIPSFLGGVADSLYEDLSRQTYQSAQDLAVFDDLAILAPVYPAFTDVALPSQYVSPGDLTLVNFRNYLKTTGGHYFLGVGTISAAVNTILYKASSLAASPTWTALYADTGDNTICGICEFKDYAIFGRQNVLKKFGVLSGSPSIGTAGTLSDSSARFGDMIAHKALGRAYFAHGALNTDGLPNKVGWYDLSTFTEGALNLGTNLGITNLDQSGNFVLVGVRPVANSQKSYIVIWNGSSASIEDIIEVGDYGLQGFHNNGGILQAITVNVPSTTSQFVQRIYQGAMGGNMDLDRELKGINSNAVNPNAINVSGNGLLIGFNNTNIYNYNSKDKKIAKFLSDNRSVSTTAAAGGNLTIKSLRDTGAEIVVNWIDTTSGVAHKISATAGVQATPSTGVYETNIFPLNGGLAGKIAKICLNHKAIPANCGFTVQIRHFGAGKWAEGVVATESYQNLLTPQGNSSTSGFTQSTDGAMMTEIQGNEKFKTARYAQLKIKFDEVSSTGFPSIVFPIIIETI